MNTNNSLNKIVEAAVILILMFSSIVGAISTAKMPTDRDYSHTVFAGAAMTQTCGHCYDWNENIYNVYISGNYDFEYASMIVFDQDGLVLNWEALHWDNSYNISSYPTTIFDGDYQRIAGDYPDQLPGVLDACGNRTVANITANITLSWLGNATIQINITIQNNEGTQYNGYIRAFITEIISRYDTSQGDPFHFGFLDFAFKENISINASEVYANSTIWNGNEHEDAHGDDFGDITPHNIKVTLVVYDINSGYVDETVAAIITLNNPPNTPSDPDPDDGATDVNIDTDLSWTGGDPDNDPVTYDVYFGTTSPPPIVISNQSSTVYDPYSLEFSTIYYWKIGAWDNFGEYVEGPIWSFITEETRESDLECNGTLNWPDVKPGETVNGFFTVKNIGEPDSLLNWKILTWPSWGNWTFTKSNGEDLKPGDIETVGVSVVAPYENSDFSGYLLLINIENGSDYEIIDVSLSTPKNKPLDFNFPLISWLFERFPNAFPILRHMLGL